MKIAIVDYGMGNIRSLISALKYVGVEEVCVSSAFHELKSADKLILPGVGSFTKAINEIKAKNIDEYLQELVIQDKMPILGICLGMQLLGMSSTENGFSAGLGYIDGHVDKFKINGLKVPHVGFNQVEIREGTGLYRDIKYKSPDFYFTHSYRMVSEQNINQSKCSYGEEFIASFERGNIAGAQFHPELSQKNGLRLIKNFVEYF